MAQKSFRAAQQQQTAEQSPSRSNQTEKNALFCFLSFLIFGILGAAMKQSPLRSTAEAPWSRPPSRVAIATPARPDATLHVIAPDAFEAVTRRRAGALDAATRRRDNGGSSGTASPALSERQQRHKSGRAVGEGAGTMLAWEAERGRLRLGAAIENPRRPSPPRRPPRPVKAIRAAPSASDRRAIEASRPSSRAPYSHRVTGTALPRPGDILVRAQSAQWLRTTPALLGSGGGGTQVLRRASSSALFVGWSGGATLATERGRRQLPPSCLEDLRVDLHLAPATLHPCAHRQRRI